MFLIFAAIAAAWAAAVPARAADCQVTLEARINSIAATWEECVGVEWARVRMQGPTGTFRVVYDGEQKTHTVTGLKPATEYRFTLQTRTAGRWGRAGEQVSTRTTGGARLPCPVMPGHCPLPACLFAPLDGLDCPALQRLATEAAADVATLEASLRAAMGAPAFQGALAFIAAAPGMSEAPKSGKTSGGGVAVFFRDVTGVESTGAYFAKPNAVNFGTPAGAAKLAAMKASEVDSAVEEQLRLLAALYHLKKARDADVALCAQQSSAEATLATQYRACEQKWSAGYKACADFAFAAWEHILVYKLDAQRDCGYPIDKAAEWK